MTRRRPARTASAISATTTAAANVSRTRMALIPHRRRHAHSPDGTGHSGSRQLGGADARLRALPGGGAGIVFVGLALRAIERLPGALEVDVLGQLDLLGQDGHRVVC